MHYKKIFSTLLWTFILGLSCNTPGSYVHSEDYILPVEESELVKLVVNFKQNNPSYVVPESVNLIDGKIDSLDHWYHIYFYYSSENKIVNTWIRSTSQGKTTFALVGLNEGLQLGNWKYINKDFSVAENRKQKEIFETRILNPIKQQIK